MKTPKRLIHIGKFSVMGKYNLKKTPRIGIGIRNVNKETIERMLKLANIRADLTNFNDITPESLESLRRLL